VFFFIQHVFVIFMVDSCCRSAAGRRGRRTTLAGTSRTRVRRRGSRRHSPSGSARPLLLPRPRWTSPSSVSITLSPLSLSFPFLPIRLNCVCRHGWEPVLWVHLTAGFHRTTSRLAAVTQLGVYSSLGKGLGILFFEHRG
jgi:hypothetical protein